MSARNFLETITHEHARMTRTPSAEADRPDGAALVARSIYEPDDDVAAIARSLRDPDRFAEIYERYFVEIYRYVAGRLGPDVADDLAAETFLIAFRKRDRVDPALGRVRPWLYGIATILVGQHRRQETRRYRALSGPAGECPPQPRATTIGSPTRSRPSGPAGSSRLPWRISARVTATCCCSLRSAS